jgi:hypothetical protein
MKDLLIVILPGTNAGNVKAKCETLVPDINVCIAGSEGYEDLVKPGVPAWASVMSRTAAQGLARRILVLPADILLNDDIKAMVKCVGIRAFAMRGGQPDPRLCIFDQGCCNDVYHTVISNKYKLLCNQAKANKSDPASYVITQCYGPVKELVPCCSTSVVSPVVSGIKKNKASRNTIAFAGYRDTWQVLLQTANTAPRVSAVAGVPCSGIAPAGMFSAITGIPVVSLDKIPGWVTSLLVLEDATEFNRFKIKYSGIVDGRKVYWGSVFASQRACIDLDYVGAVLDKPRVFSTNLLKHYRAKNWLFDIDGVICRDPELSEVCEDRKYREFMATVPALRSVKTALGTFVTGRRERFRSDTEAQLKRYGIAYKDLIMAPNAMKPRVIEHARFKAGVYKRLKSEVFIESSDKQAQLIHELTGRPVIAVDSEIGYGCRGFDKEAQGLYGDPPSLKHKRVIYTISTGDYAEAPALDFEIPAGWDFYRVTDDWCPDDIGTPKQRAAWAKINAPLLFPDAEESLCIDDDMEILFDTQPLFSSGDAVVVCTRPEADTIEKDFAVVAKYRMACKPEAYKAESDRYHKMGYHNTKSFLSGVIYRDHTQAITTELCKTWWELYQLSETQRDQPSLAVACAKLGYTPGVITADQQAKYIRHHSRKADQDGVRYKF